ncbi:MAG: peptide deformylase [Bdellovibrionota bacterium]
MILEILTFPNPKLRELSKPVKEVTEELVLYSQSMLETMYDSRGVGLAAPQVGRLDRMIVIDTRPHDDEGKPTEEGMTELEKGVQYPLVLINPEIKVKEGKTVYGEGCLSVPGYVENVERANYVEVDYLNTKGEKIRIKSDGLLAICIQHEIDHLDGKLFIDRLSFLKSNRIKDRIKKFGYETKSNEEDGEDSDENSKDNQKNL